MAAVNKKNNKKNKSSLNTKKVIVNSNKISDDHPAPVDSDVTKPSADLDVNEFEDFYNKALKEYINFKQNGELAEKEQQQPFIAKASRCGLKWIYRFSITIFLIYLLKLYIVYQMRAHLSVLSMAPKAITHTVDHVRLFILSSFQVVLGFLQSTFGIFTNLKLKNEKHLLVDDMIMGLKRKGPHRSNVDSLLLYIHLIRAIICDHVRLLLPSSFRKYICIVNRSIREHLAVFHQRVFVEIANLWKTHHTPSYDFVVLYIDLIIKKICCLLNCFLEKMKQIVL